MSPSGFKIGKYERTTEYFPWSLANSSEVRFIVHEYS
jgi:hypothetical protein